MQNRKKNFFRPWLIASLCFAFFQNAFSQSDSSQYIITKNFLSVEDGLASREVFCGIQDDDGFMWFGTRNGLNRYDGKSFQLFTKQKNGLAENKIIWLAKDNHHHLFIVYGHPGYALSAMRIEVMDLKTHRVKSLKETFPGLPFEEKYVYWVANGGDAVYFLISKPFQLWRFSDKGFELKCEMNEWNALPKTPEELITANGAYHTGSGRHCIFMKDYAALYLGNYFPGYFITPQKVIQIPAFASYRIIGINSFNEVLYSAEGRVDKINSAGVTEKNIPFPFPAAMSKENNEEFFRQNNSYDILGYTSADGLYRSDFSATHKLLAPYEIKISNGDALYGFYTDRQNNYWIFTSTGLIKIKLKQNPFTHYFTKAQLHDDAENQARGIYADDAGNVYANMWVKFYKNNNGNTFCQTKIKEILYGMCSHNNSVYAAAYHIFKYNKLKNEFSERLTSSDSREIWTLDSLSSDYLLVGCSEACYKFNTVTHDVKEVQYSSYHIPKANFIYRFIKRDDKKIWVVAQNGLYLLDENAEKVLDYWGRETEGEEQGKANHQFPFDILFDAHEDANGFFWFATNGEGLYRWDRNKNNFHQFNITAGLPSDILYRIESDDFNNLWISTDNGLVRFNTNDFKTNTYTSANGISHNEFNRTSSFKARDGRLFFGGLDGVNAFYPKDFSGDSTAEIAPLHIISFSKFSGDENKLTDKTNELLAQNKIVLQPGDRFFNLEFQLLDFSEGKLNYAYKIDGVDKDWIYIGENSVRISGLPYGEYTLRVKGQAHNGQWSRNELKVPLNVLTPFYLKWWFLLTSFFLLLASVFFFFRWRTRQLLNAKNALEKTVNERTELLKSTLDEKEILLKEIHHRVKNNLQVISSLLEMQGSRSEDESTKAAITDSQNRVLSIAFIHQNLYQHDDIRSVEVHSFVKELVQHINHVFSKPGSEVEVENNIAETLLDIDTAVPLGLIINELLTNSFKYAFPENNSGIIKMDLKKISEGEYVFTYFDNGIGLPEDFDVSKANSLGLRLVRQLCKQLAGKINYTFDNGSKFEFRLRDLEARGKM